MELKSIFILIILFLVVIFSVIYYSIVYAQFCSVCVDCPTPNKCVDTGIRVYVWWYSCEATRCCRTENGSCVEWNYSCVYRSYTCGDDRWVCGCEGYRIDKYECFEDWYCVNESSCGMRYNPVNYCGNSTDTDNGDNPEVRGTVTDRFCSNGRCTSQTYTDYCSGICIRNELVEYYVNNDRVASKTYSDLFSVGEYCKDGRKIKDVKSPSVRLNLGSRNWVNTDITETLICDDSDESGCWKYDYKIEKIN